MHHLELLTWFGVYILESLLEVKTMSDKSILGNYHFPISKAHPDNSRGNQQVIEGGKQVGSLEFIPNAETGTFDIAVTNTKGEIVFPKL